MKRKMRVIITIVLLVCMFFSLAVDAYANSTADRIKYMLRSPVLFADYAKLIEAVDTNDASKVFMTILEIYPDLVALAKKSGEEDGGNDNGGLGKSTMISDGNIITISAAIVISGAMIAAAIIIVNKKKTAALIAAANEKQNKSSEEQA